MKQEGPCRFRCDAFLGRAVSNKKEGHYTMKDDKKNAMELNTGAKKNPVFRVYTWMKNYWYYYKIPIIVILFAVVLLSSILFSIFSKEKTDFTIAIVSQLGVDTEDYDTLRENFEAHLPDIDGNGEVCVNLTSIQIDVNLTDEFSVAAYEALTSMLLYDEVVFLIVDDYCAKYLQDIQAIEPLSVLGIEGGDDEYKIAITDTDLLKDISVGEYLDYYLVVKKLSEVDRDDAWYQARREAIASMLAEVLP